jgi:NADH-quinone oxidoreductase subunit E
MAGVFNERDQARFDEELAKICARFPSEHRSAAMLPALRLVQELSGHISPEGASLVAERLGVPTTRALETATFYSMFHTEPVGRHVIDVCTNVSCCLRGGEHALAYLERKLGVRAGQTTGDKRFTLREVECLASCGTAPVMQVDEVFVENLTPSKIDQVLATVE